MNNLLKPGRILFGIAMVVFDVQSFFSVRAAVGASVDSRIATLTPSWIPAHLFWAYFTGVAFIAAAVSIPIRIQTGLAATLLGVVFLVWTIFLHAPRVFAQLHNGDELTSAFVALAMCGGVRLSRNAGKTKGRASLAV